VHRSGDRAAQVKATFRTRTLSGSMCAARGEKYLPDVPNDESREMYRVPVLVEEMARRGWLGDKTGQGFYKRVKGEGEREILTLDVDTNGVSAATEGPVRFAGSREDH